MLKNKYIVIALLSVLTSIYSCIDDVDFSQGEDFTFEQRNIVNIAHFNLTTQNFTNPLIGRVIRDTTRLDDLGKPFINENLKSIEFQFRYTNTFSQNFRSRITLLSENNQEKYNINFNVAGSQNGEAVITEHFEPVPINEIDSIKASIKMMFEIELLDNGQPIQGTLNLQSAADFIVELGSDSNGA